MSRCPICNNYITLSQGLYIIHKTLNRKTVHIFNAIKRQFRIKIDAKFGLDASSAVSLISCKKNTDNTPTAIFVG